MKRFSPRPWRNGACVSNGRRRSPSNTGGSASPTACFTNDLRVDLLVAGLLIVELKSMETLGAVHGKQVLTYLRLSRLPLGLLINFGAARFKDGCRRIVNDHRDFTSSRLRVRS